ncbi:MAG: AAA family ATPase [Anaerolineae bacterium]
MKIKNLTIQGFRGFNERCDPIDFHERLTLISGLNSYGKTSLSEALEWLLYGVTSKIESAAGGITEYKGSYRNCHFPKLETPFVEATFLESDGSEVVYRGELASDDSIQRYLNGTEVDKWPWEQVAGLAPRPFILQHALKNLLLTTPTERYKGFTRLIGAEELDRFQEHFVSLCTKYEPHIPKDVQDFLGSFSALGQRLAILPSLGAVYNLYKKKAPVLDKIYDAVIAECRNRLSEDVDEKNILPQLRKVREEAVGRIFDRRITLADYSEAERQSNAEDEGFFGAVITDEFTKQYVDLIALETIQHVLDRAKFFDLGLPLLQQTPDECPFCGLSLDEKRRTHIQDTHGALKKEVASQAAMPKQRDKVLQDLSTLRQRFQDYHNRHTNKTAALLSLRDEDTLPRLKTLLVPKYEVHFYAVEAVLSDVETSTKKLKRAYDETVKGLDAVIRSVSESGEDARLVEALGMALVEYIAVARLYAQTISSHVSAVFDADQALKRELDIQAGTEDISTLIELLERRQDIKKKLMIQEILENLKELRKAVDEYVAEKLRDVIESQLTSDVMEWYEQIKTQGDPDVHFARFGLPQTKGGTIKARQIGVEATSYGMDLPSAVSSLSESKLNALGLCMNIANNLKGGSPFSFLIIDDPIQSLDSGHAEQFICVLRKLAEDEEKQIILLSHDHEWLKDVRKGCRTLNGYYYEIASYRKSGPVIRRCLWATIDERYKEIDTILNKPDAGAMEKQRAAAEFRLLFNELAADIYRAKTGKPKNPDKLNGAAIRAILIECDMPTDYVDKIIAAYSAVSGPHHKIAYAAPVERLREYLKLADYMRKCLEEVRATASLEKAAEGVDKA